VGKLICILISIQTCNNYHLLIYIAVACPSLTDPNNGLMTCSLGDDGIPSYKDICGFICNVGYLLSGSDTRTCQSDGSWSGSETMCRKGEINIYVFCLDQSHNI